VSNFVNFFSDYVLKLGIKKSVILITLASFILSLFFTYVLVLVLGRPNEDMAISLLIAGLVSLLVAPMVCIGFIHLLFKISELENKTRYLANHDVLTGLLNRRAFYEAAGLKLKELDAENTLAIMVADIDAFKEINDRYGHEAGDRALTVVSEQFKNALRGDDLLGRLGGDEFVFCLAKIGVQDAKSLAQRIISSLNVHEFIYDNNKIALSASIGLHICKLNDNQTIADLVREADLALFEAKRSGKNQVCERFMYAIKG
jgi:diguanylate cyclase (GGDEF)-like protein